MTVFVPRGNADVVRDAFPPERVTLPNVVAPEVNVTVPVAVTPVLVMTVAVNFTDWPNVDGLREDTSVVAVKEVHTDD